MHPLNPVEWFEMVDLRRRHLSASVWIPLRQSESSRSGRKWLPGYFEETHLAGSLAVPRLKREIGDRLSWDDIGLGHQPSHYAFEDGRYKPAEEYWRNDDEPVGTHLVLLNRLNGDHPTEWTVNQDLIIALGLIQDGDTWLRVDEGYVDVIRQRRSTDDGRIVAIEIRSEHLRDYLCARGMALRIARYSSRVEVMQDASHLPWYEQIQKSGGRGDWHELRTYKVDESGARHGGRVGVFTMRRTDVDTGIDVPVFGDDTEANTASEHREFERGGLAFDRAEGAWWKDDWIEPSVRSERVRGDEPGEELFFATGASGERTGARALNHEDIRQYLWFKPEVIEALLSFRGSALVWHTRDTGGVRCSPDYIVPFGINEKYRINVYAYDVARLPLWQQRIWHGFNVSPDGRPSTELLAAQMACEPASTKAPEMGFQHLIVELNALFRVKFGGPLFKPHDSASAILGRCHRFRGTDIDGVLALAKDIARVTVDSIDLGLLNKLAPLAPKEKFGSLKMLERLLQQYLEQATARKIMAPLHLAYGLRLGDAHLPSSEIKKAFATLGVDETTPPMEIATRLLSAVCECLNGIGRTVSRGTSEDADGLARPTPA